MGKLILFIAVTCWHLTVFAQETNITVTNGDSLYQSNIKKSRLYGVYIPKDIPDALAELDRLSGEDAKMHLQKADESTVAKKLRFGIGRWMEYNWNFQEGSRFSHHLREKGLWHTDDMAEFMIIIYYRHVKKVPLDEETLLKEMIGRRKEKMQAELQKNTIEIIKK